MENFFFVQFLLAIQNVWWWLFISYYSSLTLSLTMLKNGQTYLINHAVWPIFNIMYERAEEGFEKTSALTSFASRLELSRVCIPCSHAWISTKTKLYYPNNSTLHFLKNQLLATTVLGHFILLPCQGIVIFHTNQSAKN